MRVCSVCGETNEDWMSVCQRCGSNLMDNDGYDGGDYNYDQAPQDDYSYDQQNDGGYGDYGAPQDNTPQDYMSQDMNYGAPAPVKQNNNMDLKITLAVLLVILLIMLIWAFSTLA